MKLIQVLVLTSGVLPQQIPKNVEVALELVRSKAERIWSSMIQKVFSDFNRLLEEIWKSQDEVDSIAGKPIY